MTATCLRRRRGFTFVTIIAFFGTLALGVAMVQTDTALMTIRRAAMANARARARVAATSLAASLDAGASGVANLPGAEAHTDGAVVRATVTSRGVPLEIVVPR